MPRAAKSLVSPIHLLHRASQRADGLFDQHVRGADLTPRQFAVLQVVSAQEGISQTEIMQATGIDRSSTADLVRRLVGNGCLQRRRTRRDARAYAVRITARGREMLDIGKSATSAAEEALLQPVASNQRRVFFEMLMRVAAVHEE